MKLADFDFRIIRSRELAQKDWCNNDSCICHNNLCLYGNEAKCRLGEYIDTGAEIELWSGNYDKNRTKIYENDIIRDYRGKLFIVSICKETRGWIVLEQDFSAYSSLIEVLIDGYVEVLGNIHENLELLGGGGK